MRETFFHEHLQLTRLFKKKLNENLASLGLFHSQWLVLYCINKQHSTSLVEISSYLNVEKPTISRTIKRLKEEELVETIPSEDKREKRVRLTSKGKEQYQKAFEIVSQFEKDLLMDIPEEDVMTSLKTIRKLNEKL